MIVKNEARIIRRCLDSVLPVIDSWLIVDTGSTDGTQDIIREHLREIPGELCERPWKNFGHNRSEALALARDKAAYALVIDADEELTAEPGFRFPPLTADEYMAPCRFDDSADIWNRPLLLESSRLWRYEGVVHEYPTCDGPHDRQNLSGLTLICHTDGARNANPIEKYKHDALLLEEALKTSPGNARYVFYLAQSYRDAEQPERAIAAYERRVLMSGFTEEIWNSLYQIALLKQRLGHPWPEVLAAFLRAYQSDRERAEPLCDLAAHYRGTGEWALAELFARGAASLTPPDRILHVDSSVYAWRATDELAVATYWVEKYYECATLCRRLLEGSALPESERPRVRENLRLALENSMR
jgi:glycosyltransferase involved in cell wall biosynthesis